MAYRNALIDFSEATGCVILAPLFPTSPYGDGNADGYKYLVEQDIRYDLILLAMVAELETATGLCFDKFGLFGFSGGGHFAHRFLYVHPESLSAVSIGAPGGITPLDPSQLCWTGTADLPEIFGKPFDEEALKSIPIQLVVGSNDSVRFASSTTASLSLIKGRNRIERIGELHDNYLKAGLSVRLDIVPDCGHEAMKIIPTVVGFMNGHFVK